jgi:hypothetical protein
VLSELPRIGDLVNQVVEVDATGRVVVYPLPLD